MKIRSTITAAALTAGLLVVPATAASAGTSWSSFKPPTGLSYSLPRCSEVSNWQRFLAALGVTGICR